MVVGDIITANARHLPDKIGIVDEHGVRLTWQEANSRVNSLANALSSLGLRKGDRVALISKASHRWGEFIFAVAKVGLIGVGFNYRLTRPQLLTLLRNCRPKVILVEGSSAEAIRAIDIESEGVEITIGIGKSHGFPLDYESIVAECPSHEPDVEVSEQDIHMLVYTTGTTGEPKGAMLTHKNRIMNAIAISSYMQFTADDAIITSLACHTAGFQQRFISSCFVGAKTIINAFDAEKFLELVEREKVTVAAISPTIFRLLQEYLQTSERRYDLSSLRNVPIAGGEVTNANQVREILKFFKVSVSNRSYGSTETGCLAVLRPEALAIALSPMATEKERRRIESIGKPVLNCQVKIVNEKNGEVVGLGQTGEMLAKGDLVISGYWNNPKLTERAFRNGWYHTGDLGMFDEDGYLYFMGRKDNMIKSGGFLVAPGEVERIIMQHPSVADVAVVGMPDEKWGQAVTAVVILKAGQAITGEEIKTYCREYLAGFQIPKSVRFVEKIPRDSVYNKVLMPELKRMLA